MLFPGLVERRLKSDIGKGSARGLMAIRYDDIFMIVNRLL
jgi:hypothetical protein